MATIVISGDTYEVYKTGVMKNTTIWTAVDLKNNAGIVAIDIINDVKRVAEELEALFPGTFNYYSDLSVRRSYIFFTLSTQTIDQLCEKLNIL